MRHGSEVLQSLVRRWWLIALCAFLGGQAGLFLSSLASPTYKADAYLMVTPVSKASAMQTLSEGYTQAYSKLVTTPEVIGPAARASRVSPPEIRRSVEVEAASGSPLLRITVSSDSAGEAAKLANSVGAAEAALTEKLSETTNYRAEVVAEAEPPAGPVWPNMYLNIIVGATVGLLVGGALALARGEGARSFGDEFAEGTANGRPDAAVGVSQRRSRTVRSPETRGPATGSFEDREGS